MKKLTKNITLITLLFASALVTSACSKNPSNQDTESGDNSASVSKITNIFISEIYAGESVNDYALEIGTTSTTNVNIANYKLNLYNSKELTYSYTFQNELFNKENPIVFINQSFNLTVPTVTSIKLPDDFLYGRYYLEILDDESKLIDCLGLKGFSYEYVHKGGLVRLKEHQVSTHSYDLLNYVRTAPGVTKYLGNIDAPITKEELLEGPKLDDSIYGNLPFVDSSKSLGTGGYKEVRVTSLGDGDTTHFKFLDNSYKEGKVRYLLIDTPEVYHGPDSNIKEQPWGQEAKRINNDRLRNATSILVQSNKGYSIHETYGRTLGFVWYATKKNPKASDYKLLNHEMVRLGLATFTIYDRYEGMYSRDVLYYDYCEYANEVASRAGIKIHGETDPNFQY